MVAKITNKCEVHEPVMTLWNSTVWGEYFVLKKKKIIKKKIATAAKSIQNHCNIYVKKQITLKFAALV